MFNDMPKAEFVVSMKSGLEDRNNGHVLQVQAGKQPSLNEVRPGRPEQLHKARYASAAVALSQ